MLVPPNGWFIMENPNPKWMISGYPHFRTPPYMPSLFGKSPTRRPPKKLQGAQDEEQHQHGQHQKVGSGAGTPAQFGVVT